MEIDENAFEPYRSASKAYSTSYSLLGDMEANLE